MTETRPRLTDRAALARNRARAAAGDGDAMFLHALARDEIKERLELVNRTFTKPAIVTGFPAFWADLVPDAVVVPDDDVLTLTPGAHDLVIHAMGLHWADDPLGQIIQSTRALQPDGLFLACLFGGQTLYELRGSLAEAEAAVTGGLSPRVVPMAEIRDLGGLLQRAGLALPVADAVGQAVTYGDAFRLMRDLRAMGEGNAMAARLRRPTRRAVLMQAADLYARNFSTDTGIAASFDLIFLSGWSPHPDQPKPLRPGSASHSLAEALDRAKSSPGD